MRNIKNTSPFDSVHDKNKSTSSFNSVPEKEKQKQKQKQKQKRHVSIANMRHEKNKNYFAF